MAKMTDTPEKEPVRDEPLILERLSDLESQNEYLDRYPDIRGRAVVNPTGEEVGTVDDLYVNPRNQQVGMAAITFSGVVGYGGKHVLVPVTEITILDGGVRILAADRQAGGARGFPPGSPSCEPCFEFRDSDSETADQGTERPPGRLELEDEDEYERALTGMD